VSASNTKVTRVDGGEVEAGLGVLVSTPEHVLVTWGEYADIGEADGEVRVLAAVDENGDDVTAHVAHVIAGAIAEARERGEI